jgi:hypothetical protein
VSSYFEAIFNRKQGETDPEGFKLKQFMRVHALLECFYCEDAGYHLLDMEAKNGHTYTFAFACVCKAGDRLPTASVNAITNAGLGRLYCKLGGEFNQHGALCPLTAKDKKCAGFWCPKFDTHLPG